MTPHADGFHMPAEWEPHDGCWMIWPERPDNWRLGAKPAQAAFAQVAATIARFEPVTMLTSAAQFANARAALPDSVRVVELSSNDAWARDIGPTFLVNDTNGLAGVDWPFNAWGGLLNGLYFPWHLDDGVAAKVLQLERAHGYRAPKIIEGGALHVDGEGTVLVTESCLLAEDRNPGAARQDMERVLKDHLGASHVIWLGAGVPGDETGGHVDNLACFTAPATVLLSWCDDATDPHHAVSADAEARLRSARDACGREITVHRVPMPTPMFFTDEEAAGIDRSAAETSSGSAAGMNRTAGHRLAASYVNFYIANGAIIAPAFNTATDAPARDVLASSFPHHDIIMLPAREILLGGGNIHCITQQQPKRRLGP